MPIAVVPPPYRGPTHGADRVAVPAGTVRACIDAVEAKHPGFRPLVLDEDGHVHRFVTLFKSGDQLRGAALDEPIRDGDEPEVLSAIAGG
jgi:molybdopterin converting factor small subunit